jgi:hypothetical protein
MHFFLTKTELHFLYVHTKNHRAIQKSYVEFSPTQAQKHYCKKN